MDDLYGSRGVFDAEMRDLHFLARFARGTTFERDVGEFCEELTDALGYLCGVAIVQDVEYDSQDAVRYELAYLVACRRMTPMDRVRSEGPRDLTEGYLLDVLG